MKFSELYESDDKVLEKRAKHIYTLLRKGTIDWETEDGLVKVKYQLPSQIEFGTIQLRDNRYYGTVEILEEEDNDIIYFDVEANDFINGQYGRYDDDNELFRLLFNKFKNFGVVLLDWAFFSPYKGYDYKTAISQVMGIEGNDEFEDEINENGESLNEKLTPAQKKKAKSVYAALRTGVFKVGDTKIKYVLPHDFFIDFGALTKRIMVFPDDSTKFFPVDFYLIKDDGEETLIHQHNTNLYKHLKEWVAKKFAQFDISIVF